jgi:hypothetical protein
MCGCLKQWRETAEYETDFIIIEREEKIVVDSHRGCGNGDNSCQRT